MNSRIAKVALVLALLATGAIATAVGVRAYRHRFVGRDAEGGYHFETETEVVHDGNDQDDEGRAQSSAVVVHTVTHVKPGDSGETNIEQMQSDLDEIARLREQNLGELLTVTDTQVNGRSFRSGVFRYVLADGRTLGMGENIRNDEVPQTPAQIKSDREEVARLREQGLRDVVTVIENDIEGQMHRTLICRYVLADGREKTVGEGDPVLPMPTTMLTSEQHDEVRRLQTLGEGELLGTSERQMYGKTFTFKTYLFTLADGTVVTKAEGEPVAERTTLTKADWDELRQLQTQNAGEALGTYEEEIDGTVFGFEQKRYILSDGTEVIQSKGTPKID